MMTLVLLFLALFSFNAPATAYDDEDSGYTDSVDKHIPKGGLMDCLQCPSYCLWGEPGKNVPK